MGYLVFNETDGIYASADEFETKQEAEEFIEDFPKRFEFQGYYLTSDRDKIKPEEVILVIEKV